MNLEFSVGQAGFFVRRKHLGATRIRNKALICRRYLPGGWDPNRRRSGPLPRGKSDSSRAASNSRNRSLTRAAAAGHAVGRGHVGARSRAYRRGTEGHGGSRQRGMTMILVTHEMGFARRADRVLFMRDGKVRESGPIGEVFADPRTSELRQFIASAL